jgi:hypothetical protein
MRRTASAPGFLQAEMRGDLGEFEAFQFARGDIVEHRSRNVSTTCRPWISNFGYWIVRSAICTRD